MEWEAIKNRLDVLLANGKHSEIRGAMMMLNVVDIAQYMETLEKDKLLHVFYQTFSQFGFTMLLWKIKEVDKQCILKHYRCIGICLKQAF